jgi:hypothetical protein
MGKRSKWLTACTLPKEESSLFPVWLSMLSDAKTREQRQKNPPYRDQLRSHASNGATSVIEALPVVQLI